MSQQNKPKCEGRSQLSPPPPFSPHPVGLITTSYSVLQPLRKHRTLLRQNALATNMAFFCFGFVFFFWFPLWTVTLWQTPLPRPVFGICSSLTVGAKQNRKKSALLLSQNCSGQAQPPSCPRCWALVLEGCAGRGIFLCFGPGLHQLGLDWGARTTWGISEESLPRRKDS